MKFPVLRKGNEPMKDNWREYLSYFGLYAKKAQMKKKYKYDKVSYGRNKAQYFLYYEPDEVISDKIIVWVHGGGWNAGNPKIFDYVGQCVCDQGYRFVSLGYRLSPKYKYPYQIRDVCTAYNVLDYTDHPRDVADPWYTRDFDATYRDVVEGLQGFLQYLKDENIITL